MKTARSTFTRRKFLSVSGATALAIPLGGRSVLGANETVRIGLIGCGGRDGMYSVGLDGKEKLEKFPGNGGVDHQQNFVDAVRSRRGEDLKSNIVAAERSSAVAHLANASYLSGSDVEGKAIDAAVEGDEMLTTIVREQREQLAAWGIEDPRYQLGMKLVIDPATATVRNPGADQRQLKRICREPFVVPELV